MEASLNILKTLQKAERKLEQQVNKAARELDNLRNAIAALGHKAANSVKPGKAKKRMSAATKRKIRLAQKRRWAKVRAEKKA
jgi:hypothetical protein